MSRNKYFASVEERDEQIGRVEERMTKTEELGAQIYILLKEYGLYNWDVRKRVSDDILQACKDAGLVFALKDITHAKPWAEIEEIEL